MHGLCQQQIQSLIPPRLIVTLGVAMPNVKCFNLGWILLFASATGTWAGDLETKKMTPEDFITRYEKALAAQKWEEVEPLIHPNCTVTFSNGSLHPGKAAVEEAFSRNFVVIEGEKYAISKVHWIVKTDEFAVFTFVYDWSGRISGDPVAGTGRGTSSLVNENGAWKLASEHLGARSGE